MKQANNNKNINLFENYFCRSHLKISKGKFGDFKHPWLNSSKRLNDIKNSLKLKKIVRAQLIKNLNEIHAEKYKEDYWKFVINPFLEKIITTLYEIDCIFDKLKKENKKKLNFIYAKLNFKNINVDNYDEFTKTLDTIEIKSWITSMFYSYHFKKKNFKKNYYKKDTFLRNKRKILMPENFLTRIYNNIILLFFRNFYLTENKSLKYFFIIILKYKLIPFFITEKINRVDLNEKTRSKFKFNLKNKKFQFVLNNILPKLIPKSYVENYKFIKKNNFNNFFLKRKTFFDDGVLVNSDCAKLFIANARSNNFIKFNMMQHGGAYQNKLHSYVIMEKNLSDKHLVWGTPIYSNQMQFLSPHIKNMLNINNSNSEKIIMPISLPSLFSKNMSTSISGKCYENYFLDLIIFLKTLNFEIRKNIIFRFPPGGKFLDYDLYIKKKFPEIKIDYGNKPLKNLLIKCKISICTVDSTTVLSSIVSGIPTIFFLEKKLF